MFSVKSIIFKLYGFFEKNADTYKDVNGKGIFERFNESLGEDFDENVLPSIDNFVENTLEPTSLMSRFFGYVENYLGIHISFYAIDSRRRKIIQYVNKLYDIKGTIKGYWTMLMWDGYSNVTIVEHEKISGFDSPTTFDSVHRTFDNGGCNSCYEYSIFMTGDSFPNAEKVQRVFNIIDFNQPINARLRNVYYNGSMLVRNVIQIYISDGTDGYKAGDLVYNNELDPELIIRLADLSDAPEYEVGDMIIDGPNKDRYKLNQAGDLVYYYGSFYFNNALKLNGGGQKVTIPSDVRYNFGGEDFCVSFWYKHTSNAHSIICNRIDGGVGFEVSVNNGIFIAKTVSGLEENEIQTDSQYNGSDWYHIVVSFIGADSNNWRITVNGVDVSFNLVINTMTDPSINNSADVVIGSNGVTHGDFVIDDFFIKKGIMTVAECFELWNFGDGADVNILGIVGVELRCSFDELSGLLVYDISGYDNHGTLTGIGDETNRVNH